MKVKVLAKFKDKETGKIRKKGSTFECSKARYDEILKVGAFVEEIKENEASKETKSDAKKG